MRIRPLLGVVPLLLVPELLSAQASLLEKLLSRVTDFDVYLAVAGFAPSSRVLSAADRAGSSRQTGLYGMGFELALEVGTVSKAPPKGKVPLDTTVSLSTIAITRKPNGADTTFTMAAKVAPKTPPELIWRFELALGYSQLIGVRSRSSAVDLRGAIEELPSLSLYATHINSGFYFGFRTGIVQLHSFRAYVTDTAGTLLHSANGTTLQMGPVGGIAFDLKGKMGGFLEGGYHFRKIASVEWTSPNNKIPDALPRTLNLSGWTVDVGLEFEIGNSGKTGSDDQ